MAGGDEGAAPVQPVVGDKHLAKIILKTLIDEIPKYKGTSSPTLYEFTTAIDKVAALTDCPANGKIRLAKSNLKGPAQVFLENDQPLQ
jgi:hypothetical protein